MIEFIGYTASVLIAVSLLMSNVWRLRLINLIGALIFVLYGAIAGVYPVLAVNGFIALVDLWYLAQMAGKKDIFKLLPVKAGDALLENFLAYYYRDISLYFPDFSVKDLADPRCVFILRNLLPVGLFIYTAEGETINIHLDYVAPDYRDLKNARYLYNIQQKFAELKNVTRFAAVSRSAGHTAYLTRLGFTPDPGTPGRFVKQIV